MKVSAEFQGILTREMGRSYSIIPNNVTKSIIQASAQGMVKNCDNDWRCGYFWDAIDGELGLGLVWPSC